MQYKDDSRTPYAHYRVIDTDDAYKAAAVFQALNYFGNFLSSAKIASEAEVIKQRAKRHGHHSPCFMEKKVGQKFKWTVW